jgi:hypothetical protein
LQRVADEAQVLHRDRVVEAQALDQRALIGNGRLLTEQAFDRVTDVAENRERDQRDQQQHEDGLQQAAQNYEKHRRAEKARPRGCSRGRLSA